MARGAGTGGLQFGTAPARITWSDAVARHWMRTSARGPGRSPTRSLNLGRRDAGVSPDSARSGYPEERFAIDGAQFARPR